jgi:RNA polymerase sigma-70 factor (ECF subfamily)
VASWCRRWGIAEQDIGDVLQDVFSSVADHIDRFRHDRPQDTFRGWLLTIARNKVRDDCRRRAAEPAADGGTEGLLRMQRIPDVDKTIETFDSTADGQADGSPLNRLLQAALETIRDEFHERTWRAFWAIAVDGRSTADVADDLGMTQGAVRVAKSRVLLRLRRELGDLPE